MQPNKEPWEQEISVNYPFLGVARAWGAPHWVVLSLYDTRTVIRERAIDWMLRYMSSERAGLFKRHVQSAYIEEDIRRGEVLMAKIDDAAVQWAEHG